MKGKRNRSGKKCLSIKRNELYRTAKQSTLLTMHYTVKSRISIREDLLAQILNYIKKKHAG